MCRITVIVVSLLLGYNVAIAQEWRAVFVPDQGSRVDYLPKKGGFNRNADTTSYRFEFVIPDSGDTATIRLIPTGKGQVPPEEYQAVVTHRSEDMLVLVLVLTAKPLTDKFEVYTLYPKSGVGFSTTTSAYMGNIAMKALSATNPEIPIASASIFPLRRIDR